MKLEVQQMIRSIECTRSTYKTLLLLGLRCEWNKKLPPEIAFFKILVTQKNRFDFVVQIGENVVLFSGGFVHKVDLVEVASVDDNKFRSHTIVHRNHVGGDRSFATQHALT